MPKLLPRQRNSPLLLSSADERRLSGELDISRFMALIIVAIMTAIRIAYSSGNLGA